MMRLLRPALALVPLGCLLGALALYSALILDVREAHQAGPETVDVRYAQLTASSPLALDDVPAARFTPVSVTGQRTRPEERQQWYRVTLENLAAQAAELVLTVDNPLADRITVYALAPDGSTR